ncbi:MAG: urea carboxylase [Verrucomicrobiota bacterium]
MFTKVLIANRGVIARRIERTLKRLEIGSVAVYSDADLRSLHVADADEAVAIGPAAVSESYLKTERILEAALQSGAQAVHPGYGFLSENPEFAEACERAGLAFIGPTPEQMRAFGLKHTARSLAQQLGVPLLPGTGLLDSVEHALTEAAGIGYPVMLKSTAGGGGIGMRVCASAVELQEAFAAVQRLSASNFKESGLFLEKFVAQARHIEVQIFGDGRGHVVSLGERDCSAQRRNQKVIEETPAPGLTEAQRAELCDAAVKLGRAVNYRSAGTVEFVFDAESGSFYFLEVNTRLQVEHGVTEEVTGVDLVEWMIRVAAGDVEFLKEYRHQPCGHSIQVRLYAEDPNKNFQPSCGLLTEVRFPAGIRCESWVENGTEVTPFYDPMVAKVIVKGTDRRAAIERMLNALDDTAVSGIECNREYLREVIDSPVFKAGTVTTGFLGRFVYAPHTVDVLDGGAQTTLQDYPGRVGYWAIGVPPSGPMDSLAFRFANRLVGNEASSAALEITMTGPTLRFNVPARIALTGADMGAELNGKPIRLWATVQVGAGDVLRMKAATGGGARAYLAVEGGFQAPSYLGSRATFTLGNFGGHGGRALRLGDVLHLSPEPSEKPSDPSVLPTDLIPVYSNTWEIGVIYGPHGAPDFFTESDVEMLFSTGWKVHYNSNRTGVRLIGPKPEFARPDGGEAGLHPSNIHDNAYAIGTIDFTGDMPIILGPDGPSLGGFVCPGCIVQSELWKIGQLKPGDTVLFHRLTMAAANARELCQDREIETLARLPMPGPVSGALEDAVEFRIPEKAGRVEVCYRRAGDKYLLVEYGPLVLDLSLRFRVHALMQWLEQRALSGVLDLTPGIRSLQIHYDCRTLPLAELKKILVQAEEELPALDAIEVPSRIVHLPLSWDDPSTQLAIDKYMQSVRPDAPWCPSNLEFIRRINGIESIEDVRRIVFDARYLVLGLGDVYLGAPVATPMDPRHRLVTTKYNPARTWTPENAVGIGGAYMCIYGMEGPGGYQFVGRTVQVWNTHRSTADFPAGKPWLLRFFDQIRFYPVTAEELLKHREDFLTGRFQLKVEEGAFRLKDYQEFLEANAGGIEAFRETQRAAFSAERERWAAAGQNVAECVVEADAPNVAVELPPGGQLVCAHLPGSIWEIVVGEGDTVAAGDKLLVLESMKMETAIVAPVGGVIQRVVCAKGQQVEPGQGLLVLVEA